MHDTMNEWRERERERERESDVGGGGREGPILIVILLELYS